MKVTWDGTGERLYEAGVDHGVLYPQDTSGTYPKGVAWNGLTKVTEKHSGGEAEDIFADDIQYNAVYGREKYGVNIEAYTYPDEFNDCIGFKTVGKGLTIGQQPRKNFGMTYRSKIGNDTKGTAYGYYINFVYGAHVNPAEKAHETIGDKVNPVQMSWEATTTPITVADYAPTSVMHLNCTMLSPEEIKKVEDLIYGTAEAEPRLPTPDEIMKLVPVAAVTG